MSSLSSGNNRSSKPATYWRMSAASTALTRASWFTSAASWQSILLGGKRNPLDFWDYFDTPDANNVRDKLIRTNDINRVRARYGMDGDPTIDPLSPPPSTGYHTAFDRGGQAGTNIWNQAPPDGTIRTPDIDAVRLQYGHDCIAPP